MRVGPGATVGALKLALAPQLQVESGQIQLRAECRDLRAARAAQVTTDEARLRRLCGGEVLDDDDETLDDLGVRPEANGCQLIDVYANIPLTIG